MLKTFNADTVFLQKKLIVYAIFSLWYNIWELHFVEFWYNQHDATTDANTLRKDSIEIKLFAEISCCRSLEQASKWTDKKVIQRKELFGHLLFYIFKCKE